MASGWEPVYNLVRRVPKGKVTTYGALARALGLPGGARTAGRAMFACPRGMGVPWHRVLGAGGRILLPEPRSALQRRLLESEGVRFIGARVDMSAHEWAPGAKRPRAKVRRRSSRPTRNVV
jgi:methylated-DNA-protein-cysteine methyltransferase related protein